MRSLRSAIVAALLLGLAQPAVAAKSAAAGKFAAAGKNEQFASHELILQWIDGYRSDPEPERVPDAVQAMSKLGLFKDMDTAGVFIGFVAGVLGDNQLKAESLVARMFPMPPEDQAVIIKAIAYSGLPDWKELLGKFVERMPARKVLIDQYLQGKAKVLKDLPLDSGPAPIDTLWGFYFATESFEPVQGIISALPWSEDKSDVNRLTIGSMAKWTLASNAARDKPLLDLCRAELKHQPKKVAGPLKDVVEAAEAYETGRIRKEAVAAIEELKRRGPSKSTAWAWAAQAGSTAIAVGCVVASATGHVELGLPCIVTGALSSAATKLLGGTP
ncbi:MAG TPA: hypothetical protein VE665_10130 [Hyphomicrobiaceae bacterium]|nr:hypothetical protein [Hyphomicrobiaceae bacterium]